MNKHILKKFTYNKGASFFSKANEIIRMIYVQNCFNTKDIHIHKNTISAMSKIQISYVMPSLLLWNLFNKNVKVRLTPINWSINI